MLLDGIFEQAARRQYTKQLLFSQVVAVMAAVATRAHRSVHAAYLAYRHQVGISPAALYEISQKQQRAQEAPARPQERSQRPSRGYGSAPGCSEGKSTLKGVGSSNTVAGSDAFGIFQEEMTITAPGVSNGANGTIRLHIQTEGSLTSTGDAGTGGVLVNYKVGTGPIYLLMRATVDPRSGDFYPYSGPGRNGWTITHTAVSGGSELTTFDLPFTFGTAFPVKAGLLAFAAPAKNNVIDVSFASTLRLAGIEVFGPGGAVSNFAVVSGSGTAYDADGGSPGWRCQRRRARGCRGSAVPGGCLRQRPRRRQLRSCMRLQQR
jgi:hypothetical protein